MSEYGPNPEERKSVLKGEFSDLTDPRAYIEAAKSGLDSLRKIINSVEK